MPDLRGGFAYIMAAMMAEGTTRLYEVDHIARGYADFVEKAANLGVTITESAVEVPRPGTDELAAARKA